MASRGANPTLAVARCDPVDQLLIAELAGIALAMIDVAAVDLPMPKNAFRSWQVHRCQPCEVLFAPRVAARVIVDSLADAGFSLPP